MARWRFYPSKTDPLPDIVVVAAEVATSAVNTSFLFVKELLFPTLQEPVPVVTVVTPPPFHIASVTTALVAATTFMYPALAEPVPVPTAVPSMASWFEPLSTPAMRAKGLPAYLSARAERRDMDETTVDRWFIPWSEPLRVKKFHPSFLRAERTDVDHDTIDRWFVPWSDPLRKSWQRTDKQDEYAAPVFTPTAETVTVDKWYRPLEIPVRVKSGLSPGNQQWLAFADREITAVIGIAVHLGPNIRVQNVMVGY